MPEEKKGICYAPVFRGMPAFCCVLRTITMIIALPAVILVCILVAIITFGAVNPPCWPSANMANRTESPVGDRLQVSPLAAGRYKLSENTDSWKGEIVCYTQ